MTLQREHIDYKGPCIYVIINMVKEMFYIGKTKNYKQRACTHLSELKSNTHSNIRLQRLYNKNIPLLMTPFEFCSEDVLDDREMFWISFFKTNNKQHGYNFSAGGIDLKHLNKWARQRQGLSNKGKPSPFKGVKLSPERVEKMKGVGKNIAKPYSEKHLQNIRDFHKKRKGQPRKRTTISITSTITGYTETFVNLVLAAKFLGIKGNTLSTRFGKSLEINYNNYIIKKHV